MTAVIDPAAAEPGGIAVSAPSPQSTPAVVEPGSATPESGLLEELPDSLLQPPYLYICVGAVALLLLLLLIVAVLCIRRLMGAGSSRKEVQAALREKKSKVRKTLGEIEYILHYDYVGASLSVEVLTIHITDPKIVQREDEKEFSCYFRVYLYPDMNKWKESSKQSKTFSPSFDETFTFKVVIDDLDKKQLLIRIFRHHKLLRDVAFGDATLQMGKKELKPGYAKLPVYAYNPALDDPLGEIFISLRYNTNTEKLGITIVECKNLKALDWGGTSDPYVKVLCRVQGKVVGKEKTKVMPRTLNPYYNTPFSFKVSPMKLGQVDLQVIVKDKDTIGSNEIGAVRFGLEPDSATAEEQWDSMIAKPKRPVSEWHHLMPSAD